MIEVENLWRWYGRVAALRGVSFTVARGSITGFLGPNGAGKTTAMRVLTTYLPPSAGRARVAGHDVIRDPRAVCRRVGYLPEAMPVYPELRVVEYLTHRAVLREIPVRQVRRRVGEAMQTCGLQSQQLKLLGSLSKGYRQRLGLADAVLHDPDVLILDEPTAGLDPLQVVEVREMIDNLRGRRTVILSSHILGEVEQVCDQVIILQNGEVRLQESREGWRRRVEEVGGMRIVLEGPPQSAASVLAELDGVIAVQAAGGAFELRTRGDLRRRVFQLAVARGWTILELRPLETSLESLFLHVTKRTQS